MDVVLSETAADHSPAATCSEDDVSEFADPGGDSTSLSGEEFIFFDATGEQKKSVIHLDIAFKYFTRYLLLLNYSKTIFTQFMTSLLRIYTIHQSASLLVCFTDTHIFSSK